MKSNGNRESNYEKGIVVIKMNMKIKARIGHLHVYVSESSSSVIKNNTYSY